MGKEREWQEIQEDLLPGESLQEVRNAQKERWWVLERNIAGEPEEVWKLCVEKEAVAGLGCKSAMAAFAKMYRVYRRLHPKKT